MHRLLYVEDDPMIRIATEHLLKEIEGVELVVFENGRDALAYLKNEGGVHLVVTDWNMPILDGIALTRAIRGDSGLSAIPVIMTSGNVDPMMIRTAMSAGVTRYLKKPCIPEELALAVRGLLG